MDFGKEKFGGSFTEEEVEDVKTVLRLLPLVMCLSLCVSSSTAPVNLLKTNSPINILLNYGFDITWLFVLLLIPFYQFIIHPLIRNHKPSMLKCIGIGLFLHLLGDVLLEAISFRSVLDSGDVQRYISCKTLPQTAPYPGDNIEWYYKLVPFILFGVGRTVSQVLLIEFIIAQSPDKMKGFVIGMNILFLLFVPSFLLSVTTKLGWTLCFDVMTTVTLAVGFVVFLILSKWYTLRERNREINIQAIVEEHYERYMDQEEEYMRQCHH